MVGVAAGENSIHIEQVVKGVMLQPGTYCKTLSAKTVGKDSSLASA